MEFEFISHAQAHGGGLDSSGGHHCYVGSCKGTYHSQNRKPSNQVNDSSDGWLGPLVVLILILILVGAFLRPFKKKLMTVAWVRRVCILLFRRSSAWLF